MRSVSRFDLAEFLGDAFADGAARPTTLLRIARRRGARPAVLNTVRRLPERLYTGLDDVFDALPAVPDDVDPWNPTSPPD
jgi:hypothetical protein